MQTPTPQAAQAQASFIQISSIKSNGSAESEPVATGGGCGTSHEGGKASCGTSDGPDDMPAEI
ncbi:hypothetical protein ABTL86_19565, partial [Acinetobacter baumannii]